MTHSHRQTENFLRAQHVDFDGVPKSLVELHRCDDIEDDLMDEHASEVACTANLKTQSTRSSAALTCTSFSKRFRHAASIRKSGASKSVSIGSTLLNTCGRSTRTRSKIFHTKLNCYQMHSGVWIAPYPHRFLEKLLQPFVNRQIVFAANQQVNGFHRKRAQ